MRGRPDGWFVAFACVLGASCQSAAAPPPYRPVADVKTLMQAVDAEADVVWESVKTVITEKGTEEITPKTAEEWTAIRNASVLIAESGNLLMMVPRAKDGRDWMQYSRELIDASETAIRAADARDPNRLFEAGGLINDKCMQCHEHYDPTVRRDLGKPPLP
jgi:hypothetical protein